MILIYFFAVLASLFALWRIRRRGMYFLHILQLEGYKSDEYAAWVQERIGDVGLRRSHKIGLLLLGLSYLGFFLGSAYWTALWVLPIWALTFASSRRYRIERQKKPLVQTARMKRLMASTVLISLMPLLTGVNIGVKMDHLSGLYPVLLGFFLADLGAPLWVYLASFLNRPIETYYQEGFKRAARRNLLTRPDLKIIGITGSYGKTSVKFIVAEILRLRYHVLATPASYNTPMGICIVVNNQLRPEHQVLVLEMGARSQGDIQELCDIARPDHGIVTTVGMAHLETMGSIENIAEEKGTLIANLPPEGTAILNLDDPLVANMASLAPNQVWLVSAKGNRNADIYAEDIRYGPEGATFTVVDEARNRAQFSTRLLGNHNVLNILLGIALGRAMGLRLRQMVYAIARVKPVKHRLQLRKEGAITIIDDAFNSNPVGARNAVEILGQFESGRRIIVTPGMIELGNRQWEENHLLGQHIARHADLALLVGESQTQPIQEGLRSKAYPEEQLKVVSSLFDAQDYLKSYLQPGDVVLYENDLPDQYNEG